LQHRVKLWSGYIFRIILTMSFFIQFDASKASTRQISTAASSGTSRVQRLTGRSLSEPISKLRFDVLFAELNWWRLVCQPLFTRRSDISLHCVFFDSLYLLGENSPTISRFFWGERWIPVGTLDPLESPVTVESSLQISQMRLLDDHGTYVIFKSFMILRKFE